MQPFVINRHDRLVFPSNFLPDLDFSVIETEEQLDQVIRRDFETKAPSGTEIGNRIEKGAYTDRVALMRDVALNLFWVNRFAMTMYEKVPTRWRDVPRTRGDVFLPVVQPWLDKESKVAAVEQAFASLPSAGDAATEERVWEVLFDPFRHRKHHASALEAIRPTVAQALEDPTQLTFQLGTYDPDYPVYSYTDIVDCQEDVAELEALHRWAMVLHNQYPWERADVQLTAVGELQPTTTSSCCSSRRTRRSPGSWTRSPRVRRGRRPVPGWHPSPPRSSPSSRSGRIRPSTSASSSRCCRRSRRWPSSGARSSAPTTISSVIRRTAGRR